MGGHKKICGSVRLATKLLGDSHTTPCYLTFSICRRWLNVRGKCVERTHYRLCSIDQPTPNPGISCELMGKTNRYALVTNEPLRIEKQLLEVRDFRGITDRFRGINGIYLEKSPQTLFPVQSTCSTSVRMLSQKSKWNYMSTTTMKHAYIKHLCVSAILFNVGMCSILEGHSRNHLLLLLLEELMKCHNL